VCATHPADEIIVYEQAMDDITVANQVKALTVV
jgi:hypothetical protein